MQKGNRWPDFTPPAAALCRRYRGRLLHRRSQRDVITGLTTTIDKEIKPTINQVKDITRLGKTAALIFASLGFTAGGMFIYFSETIVPPLRKWLRID